MKDLVYSTVMPIAQKWWINLLMGLLFVSLGVWVFIAPLASYVSLTIFFSLALATAGAFEIFGFHFLQKGKQKLGMVHVRRYFGPSNWGVSYIQPFNNYDRFAIYISFLAFVQGFGGVRSFPTVEDIRN